MAVWLGLADKPKGLRQLKDFDVEFSDDIKSVTTEIDITNQVLKNGNLIMDLPLPEKTLVVMVKRDNKYFVPSGDTLLIENDKLLIITDDEDALMQTLMNLGKPGAKTSS
jgi:cell volume regulation protein A